MKQIISLSIFIVILFLSCTKTEVPGELQPLNPQQGEGFEAHAFDLGLAGPAHIDVLVLDANLDTIYFEVTDNTFTDYRLYLNEMLTAKFIRVTSPVYMEYIFWNSDWEIIEQGSQITSVVQYDIP